jgi:3',5'-cyclic AMP phosphodiesterase CpdA
MKPLPRILAAATLPLLFLACLLAFPEPASDFRFSILGDRTGGAIPQVYERIWREVDLLHPDFVINVGDVIQGHDEDRAESEWWELERLWTRYPYPRYFTAGNHDIWDDASRQLYEKVTGRPPAYSFNYQDAHFTVLDTSLTRSLSEPQLNFLAEDLQRNQRSNPKFVFLHHPEWIGFLNLGSGQFPLHQLARKYGVNYVFSGHGHQFIRLARDGIQYLEVGSSGAAVGGGGSDQAFASGRFYHHLWVTVKGPKVYVTVKELDAPYGKGRMFRAQDWGDIGAEPAPSQAMTPSPHSK